MNKQELIQTHQLLALIKDDAEDRDVLDGTPEYEEFGVGPQSIHKSKNAHEEAILTLSGELAEAFEEMEVEQESEVEAETVAP